MNPEWIQSFLETMHRQYWQLDAFHEAGHVVMALSLGRKVAGVTIIIPQGPASGSAYIDWFDISTRRGRQDHGLIILAGLYSELIVVKNGETPLPWRVHPQGSFLDQVQFEDLKFSPQIQERIFTRLFEILTENWFYVQAVAAGLLEKGTLTRDEILKFCSGMKVKTAVN